MNGITSLLFDFTFSHISCEDRLMSLCCESRASGKTVGAHLDFRDLLSLILIVHVQLVLVIALVCLLNIHKSFQLFLCNWCSLC